MTSPDARRAELRRRLLAGDLDAGVALLEQLGRAGELRPDAVRLGAHLGDAAAVRVLQAGPPGDFDAWVAGLEPFGFEVWTRVGLAALRSLQPLWSDPETGHGDDARLALEVEALEAFVADPSPERAAAVGRSYSEDYDLAAAGGQAVDVWGALGRLLESHAFADLAEALDRASVGRGEARVRDAARREVCAWLFPDVAWAASPAQ